MTTAEKQKYLQEHITYEIIMLRYTYGSLYHKTEASWNAHYEAFLVHARNLRDFLSGNSKSPNQAKPNVVASLFSSTFTHSIPPKIKDIFKRAHEQVLHLGMYRDYVAPGKLQLHLEVTELYDYIGDTLAAFIAKLNNDFIGRITADTKIVRQRLVVASQHYTTSAHPVRVGS
jgi:hypothetical protein